MQTPNAASGSAFLFSMVYLLLRWVHLPTRSCSVCLLLPTASSSKDGDYALLVVTPQCLAQGLVRSRHSMVFIDLEKKNVGRASPPK